jgi:hypothetical protein
MKTKLLMLAGLATAALLVAAMMTSSSTAAGTKAKDAAKTPADAAKAPAAPAGPYDALAKANPNEIKRMEAALPTQAFAKPAKTRKLLVYTESKGYYHDSIPLAAATFKALGDKTGAWETTWSDDTTIWTPENLAKFDGVMMDNTVTNVPDTEAGKAAFNDFVKKGGGLMGIHASADCNHMNGKQWWPEYYNMIGGEFIGHPWGKVSVKLEDPSSPLLSMFDNKGFVINEEIYTFKQVDPKADGYSREKLHILLSVDNEKCGRSTEELEKVRKDKDFALAWIHEYGKGHVFYCAFGHGHDHFWNPTLLKLYLAGIQYALGDLKADATPSAQIKNAKIVSGADMNGPTINPR